MRILVKLLAAKVMLMALPMRVKGWLKIHGWL